MSSAYYNHRLFLSKENTVSIMQFHRVIVKLGTSTLTGGTAYLHRQRMLEIVQQLAHLHQQKYEVILVSSGAQSAGRTDILREGPGSIPIGVQPIQIYR